MHKRLLTIALVLILPLSAIAEEGKVFRWVDIDGQVHYGDSVPVEYSDLPKDVLNDTGVTVGIVKGKMTAEEREALRLEAERMVARDLQKRADQALLATYLTVEEILMHRDRRVELFQAQSRVTELYLSNLARRMDTLRSDAAGYKPYSEDSNAPMIPDSLANHIRETKETIDRHERNLRKFQSDEERIISRFAGDISRFKTLKGIHE
jgi:hypothetical protein